jgi:hypothetical protein
MRESDAEVIPRIQKTFLVPGKSGNRKVEASTHVSGFVNQMALAVDVLLMSPENTAIAGDGSHRPADFS